MASPFPFLLSLLLLLASLSSLPDSAAHLTLDYYAKTCPKFDQIMQETTTSKQMSNPTTAAAALRVFFHDCMVDGCDASVLVASTPLSKAERDSDLNEALAGDAFDVVTRAKNALELACPGVVSCADILAVATRNLVKYVGGPFFKVRLGRKDGRESVASHVEINLPRANTSMDQMIDMFTSKGLTVEELVALTGGGHTIGFTHCKEFSNRIFNFSSTSEVDPSLNPKFANRLRQMCANYHKNPAIAAFNDPLSPGTFDNLFFKNLLNGMGLLASDQILVADPRTKPLVELYARNQTVFFATFARAMEKTSVIGIKTGRHGEVRAQCDRFNTVRSQS
ncbi:peroxidase 41-like [Actinidia eriantha]|uniref:peroxidase 41-like n=1 Tax=Actinidia eriantha TaxID=165200 RepID=UPI0025830F7F|nr:peroxidase 41-like [Actinidia eriantha]